MISHKGIQYEFQGPVDAPVILLSNSLGTDYSMWDRQVEDLKSNYRILRYNTQGAGATSIEDLAQTVITLMDELKLSKVHFCGISLGGLTGIWLARFRPERFHSLTLANTSPKIATPEIWQTRIELVKQSGLAPVAAASPSRWFTSEFTKTRQEIVEKSLKPFSVIRPEDYLSCCEILKTTDLWSEISLISVPVMIVAGEFDQITTVDEAQKMAGLIRSSSLTVLPAAHLSNIESKDFTSALLKWIERPE